MTQGRPTAAPAHFPYDHPNMAVVMAQECARVSGRKAIGKRVRFDVFKRDGFVCQCCGAHPPAVILEVDHILAVANGGDNDPDNLITACFNCNRGKAANDLNVVPQSLADKATIVAEREEQIAGYQAILADRRLRLDADAWEVILLLLGVETIAHSDFGSVRRFVDKLGKDDVIEAAEIALASSVRPRKLFAYFCGVCWNNIRRAEAQ